MSTIQGPPNSYDFGLDFNYAVWNKDTEISMVNVPWNNDYRDIVKFADRTALDAYIDSREPTGLMFDQMSYLKPNEPIRIGAPFNRVNRYNYLRASNPSQPIDGDSQRNYYYFITDVRYVNPGTTELIIQLDVWQTFGYDITFGNCYVDRGHIGIANSNAMNNYGRDYLTVPEGIDTGSEYQIGTYRSDEIVGISTYNIMAISTVDLTADPGDVNNPKLVSASGSRVQGIVSGADIYIWEASNYFQDFLAAYADKPWVTQGILAVYIIPPITNYQSNFAHSHTAPTFGKKLDTVSSGGSISHEMFANWRNSSEIKNLFPVRYQHLSKFLTYPYMVIELTTWSATPIILKPESWANDNAEIREKSSLLPGSQRLVYTPTAYNRNPNSPIPTSGSDDGGEYLDLISIIANFITVPIVNNMAISYLASNKNGIAFQYSSADWSQQRALRGNEVNYDQASSGIDLSRQLNKLDVAGSQSMTANQNMAIAQNAANQAVYGAAQGALGGAMSGAAAGPAGAILGAAGGIASAIPGALMAQASAGVQTDLNNRNNAIQNVVSRSSNVAQTGQQSYIRDTNKGLADWAARGDYENSIAGINAKVNDSKMLQPTTSGQFGGDAFNLINDASELSIRWKTIDIASITIVGEYWLRYGYAIHKFMTLPASLMVMSKFTYWKIQQSYIVAGAMPESFKQIIRGIFEKGVTVWANPADIGNIDIADNEPLDGISY